MNHNKTSHPTSTLVCEAYMKDKQYAVKLDNNAEMQS